MDKEIKNKSGIYCIKNLKSNKVYIGQSINIRKRLIQHKCELINNKHSNPHLQNSFNKNTIDNFLFEVLEYCDKDILTEKEKYYLSDLNLIYYNIRDASDSVVHNTRTPITEETRLKLSEIKKGKTPSNLDWLQQSNRRKILYETEDIRIIFNSCKEASEYFKMKENIFHEYIGKNRKSKYFPIIYKLEYYG